MKGFKSFNSKSAIKTGVSVLVAGAGSAVADWALEKYDVIPAEYKQYTNVGKILLGAIGGSMVKNEYVKSAMDGIATVAAANLVAGYLPTEDGGGNAGGNNGGGTSGLPDGMIGRIRMGQRGFRRARVAGVQGADFMGA